MELMTTIASLGGLFLAGANVMIFCIIKFNDISHLTKSIDEIKKSIECIDKKLFTFAEKVSKLEGKCSANHPD
jgi:hypothetical protein